MQKVTPFAAFHRWDDCLRLVKKYFLYFIVPEGRPIFSSRICWPMYSTYLIIFLLSCLPLTYFLFYNIMSLLDILEVSMEHLILGLLILSPMTGYEIQRFIKQNLSLICSHSAGSVQIALSKLQRENYIAAHDTMEGRRHKKTFSITEQGRTTFFNWIAQQIDEMQKVLQTIQQRFQQAQELALPPEQDWNSILQFQGYTLAYGIAAAQFERDWYSHLLQKMEESL